MKLNLLIKIFLAAVTTLTTCIRASDEDQVIDEVLASLPADTPCLIHISAPASLTGLLKSIDDRISNEALPTISTWLADERFTWLHGVDPESDLENFSFRKRTLFDELAKLKSITLVVHSWENEYPELSIVLEGPAESREEIFKACEFLENQFRSLPWRGLPRARWHEGIKPAEDDEQQFNQAEEAHYLRLPDSGGASRFSRLKSGTLHVFTNCDAAQYFQNENRSNPKRRRLSDQRSFQRVWTQVNPKHPETRVSVFLIPAKLRTATKSFVSETDWAAYQMNEIVSVGANLQISETLFDTTLDSPMVAGKVVFAFTLPRTGIAAFWESGQSLFELPKIPFRIHELRAHSYDQKRKLEIVDQIRKSSNARLPSETEAKIERYRSLGLDYLSDVLPGEGDKLVLRYRQPFRNSASSSSLLYARVVENEAVSFRLANVELNRANANRGDQNRLAPTTTRIPDALCFAETEEFAGFVQQELEEWRAKKLTDDKGGKPEKPIYPLYRKAIYVDPRWLIEGELQGILKFAEANGTLPIGEDVVDYGLNLRSQIENLQARIPDGGDLFAVDAFSPLSWELWAYQRYYDWMNTLPYATFQRFNRFRAPEGRGEAFALASTLVAESVLNALGSQLWLYSQSDSMMTVRFGIYHAPEQLFGGDLMDEADQNEESASTRRTDLYLRGLTSPGKRAEGSR